MLLLKKNERNRKKRWKLSENWSKFFFQPLVLLGLLLCLTMYTISVGLLERVYRGSLLNTYCIVVVKHITFCVLYLIITQSAHCCVRGAVMFLDSMLLTGWMFGCLPQKRPKKCERQDKSASILWLHLPKNSLKNGKTFLKVFFLIYYKFNQIYFFLVLDLDLFDQLCARWPKNLQGSWQHPSY